MKNLTLSAAVLLCTISTAQSLPPVAQDLYDQAVAQDSLMVQYALNAGAQIIATTDDSSFYIQWFPAGPIPANMPVIVTLHGSNGFAFHEFYNWHQQAMQHGCGIIAIQWWRGNNAIAPNDYFNDARLYEFIDTALSRINYPPGKAFFHGFSRGSSRSYGVIFNDSHGGQNYFCTALSNAGQADSLYPLYDSIYNNYFGSNVFLGKRWALYCGANDSNPTQSGCPAMNYTQNWLIAQGATVDVFFQDPIGDHNGFNDTTIYKDSILNYYLLCYNGSLSLGDDHANEPLRVYPNPFTDVITISGNVNPVEITVLSLSGQVVMHSLLTSQINLAILESGIYILCITDTEGTNWRQKLVKKS